MNYQVLARKWRPQEFSEVIGQKHIVSALSNTLSLDRIHHAYLFSGTRGVGKTTIARLFAKGLSCKVRITATPCGSCHHCRDIVEGCFVDLIEIDAASRTKVEDTRDLLDNIQYYPAQGRFKIYLIDEVHMLSRHSFNALLKTLEEPPGHVKFILATTDPQKLPVTILSRCLQFHLKLIDEDLIRVQLQSILKSENISAEDRGVRLIAHAAEGSMRDALSLTDQAIVMGKGVITVNSVHDMLGMFDDDKILSLIEALVNSNGELVMNIINEVAVYGNNWDSFLEKILEILHYIAILQFLPSSFREDMVSFGLRLRKVARLISPEDVQLYYQIVLIGRKELPLAPSHRMGVEMTLFRALVFHPGEVISSSIMSSSKDRKGVSSCSSVPDVIDTLELDSDERLQCLSETATQLIDSQNQLRLHKSGISQLKNNKMMSKIDRSLNRDLEKPLKINKGDLLSYNSTVFKDVFKKETVLSAGCNLSLLEEQLHDVFQKSDFPYNKRNHQSYQLLMMKVIEEASARDPWSSKLAILTISKLGKNLALHTWKEKKEYGICLHLRSGNRHLSTLEANKELHEALNQDAGYIIDLRIVEDDDNKLMLTPLEWQNKIYHERLIKARKLILKDKYIKSLCDFFDAIIEEESIQPL
ncbi:DNA polymerase III subunit gamma/tau [Candidatus Erwinia haradaeae]|uniref:DNA polymerase III subunit gamma/tau n=1 Tax=Candidatus Erwinia haradaeae TaxID=1922217 RepID=A0A803GC98_9GAMM|nr:DNA polymerase III subunit gamma/tau [Candidatus Erwinia haradaeae]VFP87454.1 DNA polymerase III subunit tau [Candidatus Erwinia haradaeae]